MSSSIKATRAVGGKRSKHHDKDKYYRLAKEQGYRSRAAFKLIQINKKFKFLQSAKIVIDLCAAPGGWSQVAAKTMARDGMVIALDLLPIRDIRNVSAHVADITTEKARAIIRKEMQNSKADVVLCDGAPNIGASYDKDSYEQNEIVLLSLRCATEHLIKDGTFVTKVYRSADYNALLWVLKQLFRSVEAVKPASSRQQSAEIFLVCGGYFAPASIDPRLLDPRSVFEEVTDPEAASKQPKIFDKDYGVQKRHRQGYADDLDSTLRRLRPVSSFVGGEDPIQMLSECHGFTFHGEDDKVFLEHPGTDSEVREALTDLKLLGKAEFKMLLKWRLEMREFLAEGDGGDDEEEGEGAGSEGKARKRATREETEDDIQKEIEELKLKKLRKQKREKKKEREAAARVRTRKALGMEDKVNYDEEEHVDVFSLATIKSKKGLDLVQDVDLDKVRSMDFEDSEEEEEEEEEVDDDDDERRLESEMDAAYDTYLRNTKNGLAKSGTKMAKRTKKERVKRAQEMAEEDDELMKMDLGHDAKAYAKLLNGDKDSDDSDGDTSSDDGFFSDEEKGRDDAPLIVKFEESKNTKVDRFFSNPLFDGIDGDANEDGDSSSDEADDEEEPAKKRSKVDVDEVLASMPKTDKEIRKEKRAKAQERLQRRDKRRDKIAGVGMEVVKSSGSDDKADAELALLDEGAKKRILKAREMIKAGMGAAGKGAEDGSKLEIAPALGRIDDRKYDSDEEDYDSDDHAELLALGTMMLRKSKAKALVDASYNRYATNDPQDLPDWFRDDEAKHHRPQLPVPPALIAKIKAKHMSLAEKPIKKVAEARARKSKRASAALKAAKAKASAVANSGEMTEAQKLKAISKAMRGKEAKNPAKTYVVAKKNGGKQGGKGVKLVDKREKSDKRGMERARGKGKGKKGGLVGNKRRHHHS